MHRAVLLHVAIGGWLVAASERALLLVGPPPVRSNLPPTPLYGGLESVKAVKPKVLFPHACLAASVLIVAGGAATYQGGSLPSMRKPVHVSCVLRGSLSSLLNNILVDPASSHMLVSKIKPCMSKFTLSYGETANGSLNQSRFLR